ncbi:MAG: hypothetical protein ACYC0C_18430 [Devosia sp.]
MRFTEAFAKLGYSVVSPRQDWSAANERGTCLSLWKKEMGFEGGRSWVDTRIHAGPHELWASKHGNVLRIEHIRKAIKEFDGYVDVVLVQGTPGQGVDDAEPWIVDQRQGHRWRVTDFDGATGHFRAEVVPSATH